MRLRGEFWKTVAILGAIALAAPGHSAIGVPVDIQLDTDEFAVMKTHVEHGMDIAAGLDDRGIYFRIGEAF